MKQSGVVGQLYGKSLTKSFNAKVHQNRGRKVYSRISRQSNHRDNRMALGRAGAFFFLENCGVCLRSNVKEGRSSFLIYLRCFFSMWYAFCQSAHRMRTQKTMLQSQIRRSCLASPRRIGLVWLSLPKKGRPYDMHVSSPTVAICGWLKCRAARGCVPPRCQVDGVAVGFPLTRVCHMWTVLPVPDRTFAFGRAASLEATMMCRRTAIPAQRNAAPRLQPCFFSLLRSKDNCEASAALDLGRPRNGI